MSACYRFRVNGRVQGVYFRQSTRQRAAQLGVAGWVRNHPDGTVEGLAIGDPEALEQLRLWLHRGPTAARVDQLTWETASPDTVGATDFQVLA